MAYWCCKADFGEHEPTCRNAKPIWEDEETRLTRHPHSIAGDMCSNGFCLTCQQVHSFFVESKK